MNQSTSITVLEAYSAMCKYLERVYELTGSDEVGGLLGSMSLLPDGQTADPGSWSDWVQSVAAVKAGEAAVELSLARPRSTDAGENESVTTHAPLTRQELHDIRARCAAATPGPWKAFLEGREHESGADFIRTGEDTTRGDDIEMSGATPADFEFIANARQDVPRLLNEIERLRSLLI